MIFDHIVVGAGSAGCVLAARLTEDPACRVLLLEAGPPDRSPWIHLPIGYGRTMWDRRLNWAFSTEPEAELDGRRIYWPRGKTLGGSSAINGLIYIRGQAQDYDRWAALGNPGWAWNDVLPYFRRSESSSRGGDRLRGADGPLSVSDIDRRHPLIDAFIEAAEACGLPRNDDFNGPTQEGAGYYQLTTRRGLRSSTATAFLKPARRRPNLVVLTDAQALSLLSRSDRVHGVRYRHGGEVREASCDGDVLLCAGAVQSPQLLQLSGIGPARVLERHGIPVLADLPGVGGNLQDHLQMRLVFECNRPITTNDDLRSPWRSARIALQWLWSRSGPLALGINQGGCFLRAMPDAVTPDVQFHVATLSADMAGGRVHDFSGFTVSVCPLRPASRGRVEIRSPDPLQPPAILANYLSEAGDRATAVAAVRAARRIARSPPLRSLIQREVLPGPSPDDDDALLSFCRAHAATIFHPAGTCRMGSDDDAVVDSELRVRAVRGLRVVDASIMPTLVSGNTNAPVIMIAEKAADLLRAGAAGSRTGAAVRNAAA